MKIMSNKLLAFTIIACALPNLIMAQGGNSVRNVTNKMNITSFNKYLPNAIVDSGYYILNINENEICIEMANETKRNMQHYMIVNCFDASDFIISSNTSSSVNRDSGNLEFQSLTENKGEFIFKKNPDFVKFLKNEGVSLNNDLYYFKLFLGDIDEAYVLDIKKLGYQPTITDLGRLVWHDASVTYIEKMGAMFPDFNLNDISNLSAHNISTKYLREFIALGVIEMDIHSIKKAKSIGITPQIIVDQKRRGNNYTDLKSYVRLLKNK